MSKQYTKECNRCHQQIKMSDESGTWKAYTINDNSIHECNGKRTKNVTVSNSVPANSNGNGNDLSLDVFLKKLESIGITIDLEKLRNAK